MLGEVVVLTAQPRAQRWLDYEWSHGEVMPPVKTQHDERLGTVLEGAYRIVRLLGEGGMGAVYEAIQLRLNKRVAIKLMACRLAANNDALARFRREAEITSRLGHPNLVNVIDFGSSQAGEPYLVMEYLEGEDLEARLRRCRTLPVPLVVHIVKQTASALAAAHAQGVVHRDLKPANVFLVHVPGEMEFVKVLDFGVSKVKAAGVKLTRASVALGTPTYMSPEQAAGRADEIDHPADQWALACIAWEMLSSRGPFVADDVNALFYQILNLQPPSLLLKVPSLEPEAELVLLRALAKAPHGRFPSIRDFASAFEASALGRPAEVTPMPMVLPPLALIDSADATIADAEVKPLPKQLTTFSRTTGEITEQVLPKPQARMRRSRYVLGSLGFAAAAALALLLVRPHSPSMVTAAPAVRTWPVAAPAPPAAPSISPLASTPSPPAEVAGLVDGSSAARNVVKRSHMTGGAAATETKSDRRGGKRKTASVPKGAALPLQPRVKRTIIREL
jgi:serine/threonine protein kinase